MPAAAPARPKTPAPPGVVAIVNGKNIYRAQVADEALKIVGADALVNQMILIELIQQEAARMHLAATPEDVDKRITDTEKQYAERGIPGGLDTVLAQRHMTLATYKEQLQTELTVENLVAKTLPPVKPTLRFHARHLLILTTSPGAPMAPGAKPPHTNAEALALIAKAQAELKAGKSFQEVANQYTEDPSGKGNGGDLKLIDATTQFDPNFLHAALALKPGQVTPTPVKSSYGYHLIKIDSSSAAPLPSDRKLYEDAATADHLKQIQQAIPAYVQALRARSKVVDYLSTP